MKATVIRLSDSSRELFKKMSFPEIPAEANYIAFTDDGDTLFLKKLDMTVAFARPKFTFLAHYDVENLSIE